MRRPLSILSALALICALSTQSSAQTDRPLSNQDIIRLVKVGLTADLIIKKIEDSPAAYDLSVDGFTLLARKRLPSEVIKEMQATAVHQQAKPPLTSPDGDRASTAGGRGPSQVIEAHLPTRRSPITRV